jgi:hypothetical protein
MKSDLLAVGTVADRHQMAYPVEHFLIHSIELMPHAAQYNYDLVYERALHMSFDARRFCGVALYYSGYTPAYQAAIDAFEARGIPVIPMAWNKKTDAYSPIRRRRDAPVEAHSQDHL